MIGFLRRKSFSRLAPLFIVSSLCFLSSLVLLWNRNALLDFTSRIGWRHAPWLSTSQDEVSIRTRKLTMINIWNPRPSSKLSYLPGFFSCVAMNPNVDLLFVKYNNQGLDCEETLAPPGMTNVKEVCLSTHEYWTLHVDFLCKHWTCTNVQRKTLLAELQRRAPYDDFNSFFRPFRAEVFGRFIDPETALWGWSDMDECWGSFERNFPWDLADDFEIFVAGLPLRDNGLPGGLQVMAGEMTLFRRSEHVIEQFLRYPALRSLEAYLTEPPVSHWAEEIEYSHWAFLHTDLTYFLGLQRTRPHAYQLLSNPYGVYWFRYQSTSHFESPLEVESTEDPIRLRPPAQREIEEAVARHVAEWKPGPTFTERGIEYDAGPPREGAPDEHIWFEDNFGVSIALNRSKLPQEIGREYQYRRTRNGPVFHRWEPPPRAIEIPASLGTVPGTARPVLLEAFYYHFSGEKNLDWLREFMSKPIPPGTISFQRWDTGAQLWQTEESSCDGCKKKFIYPL